MNNDAFIKYFSNRDVTRGSDGAGRLDNGGTGIDFDQNPSKVAADKVHNPIFDYVTGSGNDGVNMEVSGWVAADRDFKMNIDTGAGNDHVKFRFTGEGASYWLLNQRSLDNVKINTGIGNDVVELPGQGDVIVDLGIGNDVAYSDNTGTGSVFIMHAEKTTVLPAPDGVLPLQTDIQANDNLHHTVSAESGEQIKVRVSFLGHTVESISMPFDSYDNATKTAKISTEKLNQLVIDTIEQDHVLSHLLDARDGSGQSLIIESLIDGGVDFSNLSVNFFHGSSGSITNWPALDAFYSNGSHGAMLQKGTGAANGGCDNVFNPGTGDDLIVLSSAFDANHKETIVMNGVNTDRLTVVNFDPANDKFIAADGVELLIGGPVIDGHPREVYLYRSDDPLKNNYDKVILLDKVDGSGGVTPPTPGGTFDVNSDGTTDVGGSDMTAKVSFPATGDLVYTLENFAAGDKIDLPDAALGTVNIVDDDFTDGIIVIEANNGSQNITITLTGVDHALEGTMTDVASFNAAFGAGSLF